MGVYLCVRVKLICVRFRERDREMGYQIYCVSCPAPPYLVRLSITQTADERRVQRAPLFAEKLNLNNKLR